MKNHYISLKMASRTVLSLYKNMMREAGKFTDVNFRYGFNLFRREFLDRTTQFFRAKTLTVFLF